MMFRWLRRLLDLERFWSAAAASQVKETERLMDVMAQACDLLAERTHGSPARSPAHNARLLLESALPHGFRGFGKPPAQGSDLQKATSVG